jgi:hypothetical protein
MRYTDILVFCCVSLYLVSCSSSKKVTEPTGHLSDSLPLLPASEIDIPIKIFAVPILAKAESIVPLEFVSDSWPNYLQPSCDFRYKYRFTRSALSITCMSGKIGVQFLGSYQIAGSRCLCSQNKPVTPWLSGSCGFGKEPMRRVNITIGSQLSFLPSYQLHTVTSVRQLQATDKCMVSLFSSDMTEMVIDSIRSSIASFCTALDTTLGGLNFAGLQLLAREKCYQKTNLGAYGYLTINPSSARVGLLDYAKDTFAISLGLTCRPALGSDSSNPAPTLAALPALQQKDSRSGMTLYVNASYDYEFLSRLLDDSLRNKVFEIKGRTIVVKYVQLKPLGNRQVEIRVDFSGSNKGSIYMRGTPMLDSAKQTLSVPDLSYSLESQDLALKMAKSLFRNKIKKTLEGKSYLDVAALVKSNLLAMNRQLNRKLMDNLFMAGQVRDVRILGLRAGTDAIQMQIGIAGEVSIISNGKL